MAMEDYLMGEIDIDALKQRIVAASLRRQMHVPNESGEPKEPDAAPEKA